MRLTGNKGEWSELYAFVKLLSTGRLYAADENARKIDDTYFPIIKIMRAEESDRKMEYLIRSDDGTVEVYWNTERVRSLTRKRLQKIAEYLYGGIINGSNRAFEIEGSEEVLNLLDCDKIVAPSTDKTDILMQLHDINTGVNPVCGFSIKSELGSAPTLLNASGATNFVYEVFNVSDDQMEQINAINSDTKILDRIESICAIGEMKFLHAKNTNFSCNLMLIDTYMEDIIAFLLMDYYRNSASDCNTLVKRLEDKNPLGYPRKGIYEYKFKKFLCSVALGMMPSKMWNGRDEANGGYVIVKDDGDVVAYHLYNRDAFENYLLMHTKFEKGSTTRHGFASIYKGSDGKKYINLNLQIRFI